MLIKTNEVNFPPACQLVVGEIELPMNEFTGFVSEWVEIIVEQVAAGLTLNAIHISHFKG